MRQKEYYKRTVMYFISLLILGILTFLFGLVWYNSYSDEIVQPFFRKGNWLVIAIYCGLLYIITRLYGGYRVGFLKNSDVLYSSILSLLMVNFITYLQISLIGRKFMLPSPFLWMTLGQVVCIVLWFFFANWMYKQLFPPRKLLVVYGSEQVDSLISKMQARKEKYEIQDMISIDEEASFICEMMLKYDGVVFCDIKSDKRSPLLKFCFSHSIRTYLTPKISDTIIRGAESIHLFDTPLLLCRNMGLSFEQRFVKRALDILLSGVAVVIASPFMLLSALLIKLYDGGPVFYKQTRLTLDGRKFKVYKFRSMIVDAEKESGARLASQGDDRITPIGRVLRKIRFDELPQLLNILKGDMSIVGPRPERPEIAAEYMKAMPEFAFRLKVKAGLTGYAQIMGKYNTTPYDKLKLDLMYIENYSFFLDLKMMFMTIKILFVPESTEGIQEGSTTAMISRKEHLADKINKQKDG